MMKTRTTAVALLATFTLGLGCAGADGGDDALPPDAESGLETVDGRADSLAIQPGSDEAEVVLAFVNQPIADNAAGTDFVTLLDGSLHRWAAENIGAHRAGPDGAYGTADDQTFGDLRTLDGVPWVGPVALMQLYDLAAEHGHEAPQPAVRCSELIPTRDGTFVFDRPEALTELDAADCTVLDADVKIDLRDRYLAPNARELQAFSDITEIRGELNVHVDSSTVSAINFPALERAERVELRNDDVERKVGADFSSMVDVEEIELVGIDGADFRSLETIYTLSIKRGTRTPENFSALREANGGITFFYLANDREIQVSFPALERASGLRLMSSFARPLHGEFPVLESARSFHFVRFDMSETSFPKVVETQRIKTRYTENSYAPFVALEHVEAIQNLDDRGPHVGIPTLKSIGTFSFSESADGPFTGFDSVTTIDTLEITQDCSTQEGIFGPIPDEFDAFNRLETARSIDIEPRNCDIEGFAALQSIEESLHIENQASIAGFDALEFVGENVTMPLIDDGDDLPALTYVGGNFTAHHDEDFTGFHALDTVEGTLRATCDHDRIRAFENLKGIGADLRVSEGVWRSDVDRIVEQLTAFGGNVFFE